MSARDPASLPPKSRSQRNFNRDRLVLPAVRVACTYLVIGLLWIVLSDLTLSLSGGLTLLGLLVSASKGAAFVLVSAGLVFALCWREYREIGRATNLLHAVIDGTTDAIFVKDMDGRYLLVNSAAARFCGRPVEEILGQDDRQVFDADEAEQLMASDRSIIAGGRVVTLEETLTSDGMTRSYQATKAPYYDSNNQAIGLIGISRDITDRLQVETTLRETDARLRQAQHIARLGSWSWEPPTDRVWWSDAEFELFGLELNSVVPGLAAFLELLHPDDRAVVIERVDAMKAGANEFANDLRIVRGDGTIMWIHSQARATRDASGNLIRVEGTDQDITAQKIAQAELRDSERRLRLALEAAGAIAFVWDIPTDSVIRYYSTEPALPVTKERPANLNEVRAAIHPEDLEMFDAALSKCMAEGSEYRNEYRVIRPDGSVACLEEHGFLDRAEDGSPLSLTGLVIDVSKRVAATDALRESEARYRQLVNMLPLAIFVHVDNKVVFGNAAMSHLMGVKDESELMGRSILDLVHPSSQETLRQRQEEMARTGKSVAGCDMLAVRFDGRTVPVHVIAAPVDGYGNRATLVAVSDLTERERSAALLKSVLDSVDDAILTIDTRGTITSANRSTERLFQYSASDLLGRNVSILMPEYHRQQHDQYISNYVQTRIPKVIGLGREVEGRRRDGTTFPAELTVTEFMRDGEREFTGVLRDITARRQLEEQFRQAQKMEAIGRLAGGVAHDFNNLLTIINGYSEIILGELASDDPSRASLAAIHDAGERAARLTEQMLAFSRKSMTEPRLVDLNSLVVESVKLYRRMIGEDIAISLLTDPRGVYVVLDPGQLEQVLMNLAVNARDAMPTGGRLTIETKIVELGNDASRIMASLPAGKYASLRITDTGCGISPEIKEKIFEPFFTTKPLGKGTGLGLAVVHGIVQQSGGSITVDTAVGVGTTFHILLPAVAKATQDEVIQHAAVVPPGKETVLVVEDEDAVRRLVRLALEGQGYTVLTASCGSEAQTVLKAHSGPIDLLLTDVIMPQISGRDLAQSIRQARPGLRVLYMSGYTDDALDRHGIQNATDQFIQKPFTPLTLARRIREVLDRPV